MGITAQKLVKRMNEVKPIHLIERSDCLFSVLRNLVLEFIKIKYFYAKFAHKFRNE